MVSNNIQIENYLKYLNTYILEAMMFKIPDISRFHVLQTYEFTANDELLKFKVAFSEISQSINYDINKEFFFKKMKKDFYPIITRYNSFHNAQYDHLKRVLSRDNMNTSVINHYNGIIKPFNDFSNPYTVLLELCKETKAEIELLNTPQPTPNLIKGVWKNISENPLISAIVAGLVVTIIIHFA